MILITTPPEGADLERFNLLFVKYASSMVSYAYRILKDRQQAEDAVQWAFLALSENISNVEELDCDKTRNYIVTIVKRKAFDLLKQTRQEQESLSFDAEEDFPDGSGPQWDGLGRGEQQEQLAEALSMLNETDRKLITFKYIFGYREKEIAKALGLTVSNVGTKLQRAKKKLAEAIKKTEADTLL